MTKAALSTKQANKQTAPAKPKVIPDIYISSATTKTKRSVPGKKTPPAAEVTSSKQDRLIAMMKQAKGSTMAELMTATGWQAHSIRGVISSVLKKRLSLNVILESSADGVRRYRILKSAQA